MTTVVRRREDGVARPLKTLVPLIKDELEAGDAAGIEHYRRAGEMLIEAKEQVLHGEWIGWLDRTFHLSASTARRYMQLAEVAESRPRARFESVRQATRPDEPSHGSWQAPVQQVVSRVNYEALAQERQDRQRENQLKRQLALQLIDIGYRVLSQKLHPDKRGGSHEAMKRLNEVRKLLKEAVS